MHERNVHKSGALLHSDGLLLLDELSELLAVRLGFLAGLLERARLCTDSRLVDLEGDRVMNGCGMKGEPVQGS